MSRAETFSEAPVEPRTVNDSRFGIRHLMNNRLEYPRIASYASPGSGANGEHQN